MISLVSFHRFTLINFLRLPLSNMDLLILSNWFWAGFSDRILGLFKKCRLWSFKVIKQLFLPFTNNRLTTSLFSTIFFPSALTLLLILSGIFCTLTLYLSVSIWYILDVLTAKTKSFPICKNEDLSSFRLYYIQLKEVKIL